MKFNFRLVATFTVAVLLAACGDSKFEGKTAEQWAAEARAKQSAPPSAPAVLMPPKVDEAAEKLKQDQQRAVADAEYKSAIDTKVKTMEGDPKGAGGLVLQAAVEAVTGFTDTRSDDGLVLFGNFSWVAVDKANYALAPSGSPGEFSREVTEDGQTKIRRAVIAWAVSNPSTLTTFWSAFRPTLRQQYALLKTTREYMAFYKTPYTRAAFEPLTECLQWYQNVASPREGRETKVSEADQARCATIFQKFGVKADFKNLVAESTHVRNSLWLARFFARRDADGGEKFVRQIQNLMVDYTK